MILVDDDDNEVGTASREECHRGTGLLHRAFVLLIENGRDEVLVQWRCHNKLGGGRWDVSAASHVRKGESYETAIVRCAAHELGIGRPVAWRRVLSYVYTERLGSCSEKEFCSLFAGRYDGSLRPNYAELDELRWVRLADLADQICAEPVRYTSWLTQAVTRLTS